MPQLSGVSPTIIETLRDPHLTLGPLLLLLLPSMTGPCVLESDGRKEGRAEGGVKVFPLPFRAMPMIDKGREWDPPEGPEGRRPWKGGKYTDSALLLQN